MKKESVLHHQAFADADAACQSCRFFRPQDKGNGSCHRYPPGFAGEASPKEMHHWRFPVVHGHAWCGEYQAEGQAGKAH